MKEKITKTPQFNLHLMPVKNLNQELAVAEYERLNSRRLTLIFEASNSEFETHSPSPTKPVERSPIKRSDSFKNSPSRKLSPR